MPLRRATAPDAVVLVKRGRAGAVISTAEIVAVDRSRRTPDRQWLVDEVVDEPGVGYRIWHEGEFADSIDRDPESLRTWLAAHGILVEQLEPAKDDDPFCE